MRQSGWHFVFEALISVAFSSLSAPYALPKTLNLLPLFAQNR
jgi:hypothetical protein